MSCDANRHYIHNRTLILEEYPEQNMKFLEEQNIQFLQFGIAGNKVWAGCYVEKVAMLILIRRYRNRLFKVGHHCILTHKKKNK